MSSRSSDVPEWISRFVDGELTEADAQRLLERMDEAPELDALLYVNLFVDHLLRRSVRSAPMEEEMDAIETEHDEHFFAALAGWERNAPVFDPGPEDAGPIGFPTGLPTGIDGIDGTGRHAATYRAKRRDRLPPVQALFAIFGLIVFVAGLSWLGRVSVPETVPVPRFVPFARVVETAEAAWNDPENTFKKGAEVGADRFSLRSGTVELEFADGARVALEGPAEFLINDKRKTFCQFGKLSVHVPPAASGFEVATPFSSVIDIGTQFSLDVTKNACEVHVHTGLVELDRIAVTDRRLTEGAAAKIDEKGFLTHGRADPARFLSGAEVRRRAERERSERRTRREELANRLAADASLLYLLDAGRAAETVVGCVRVPGSRSERSAFAFSSPGDRIELTVPGEHRGLTLAALVRIDSLDRSIGTLFLSRDFYDTGGGVLWQIDRTGTAQFHVRGGDRHDQCELPGFFVRKDWKTWTFLAMTADPERGRVVFYKDGREVGAVRWAADIPLRLGEASIGNERPDRKKSTPRFLNGAIGEMVIFNRPLAATEITDLYEKL